MSNFCPIFDIHQTCNECPQVEEQWHTDRLLIDLAKYKGRSLSDTEQCWLFLLLCGLSPNEIAKRFSYSQKSTSAISRTIYSYVKSLTQKSIKHWAQVRLHLEQNQYRKKCSDRLEIQVVILGELDRETSKHIVKKIKNKLDELN